MEIILLERVQNLGDLGDLVKVRPGYARNYLIPKGKAAPATAENKAKFEQRRKELEQAAQAKLAEAKTRAEQLTGASISVTRRASDEGKLFGSVGPVDIAEAMTAAGMTLAKAEIQLAEGPLKMVGSHEVEIVLHPEVHGTITVEVVGEQGADMLNEALADDGVQAETDSAADTAADDS